MTSINLVFRKMVLKYLMINYEYPPVGGGAGTATRAFAIELTEMGNQVVVLTSRYSGQAKEENQDGVNIVRLPCLRKKMSESNPFEMLTFLFSGIFFARHRLNNYKPDIILAFFSIPCGPIGWWLKKRIGSPYGVLLRGGDIPGFWPEKLSVYHKLTSPLTKFVWKGARFVAANSKGAKSLAKATGWNIPIDIVPNGVDTNYFKPKEKRTSLDNAKIIFVGRLTGQKGLMDLLEALATISAQEYPWFLEIVGDGPLRKELEASINKFGIDDKVIFKGWLLREEVRDAYAQADIFCLPSVDEGMPNVLLEAMASGLPSVATIIPGVSELITNHEEGYLVDPGDVGALKNALQKLIDDKELRRYMGNRARESAENRSWRSMANKLDRLARKALNSAKDARK